MKNLKNFDYCINQSTENSSDWEDNPSNFEPTPSVQPDRTKDWEYSGNYLDLEILPNGLWIHLNEDGKLKNEEDDDLTQQNFWDYFEDIEGNSDWKYIDDMGEAGFGLTQAPGIIQGYYIDDNSKLTDDEDENSKVYYYDNYMINDFTDKLKENGKVFFHKA